MRITRRTRTRDILPLLNGERLEELLKSVPRVQFSKKRVVEMSIAEFAEVSDEGYVLKIIAGEKRALQMLGKVKDYREQMSELGKFIEKHRVEQGKDEKLAAQGVDFPGTIARMLMSVTQFFHLHSFDEAEKISVSAYLMIMQSEAADAQYQRNYNRIINQKSKK